MMKAGRRRKDPKTVSSRWVEEVDYRLSDVKRARRRELLDLVAEHLEERPHAESWEDLAAEIGTPSEYATALRVENGLTPWVRPGRRMWPEKPLTRLLLVAGILAVVGAGVGFRYWATADPGIYSGCIGLTPDPGVEVEEREAASVTEYRVGYVDGAKVGLSFCLSAEQRAGVQILDVVVPGGDGALFQQTATSVVDLSRQPHREPAPLDKPIPLPLRDRLEVLTDLRLGHCESYDAGGGTGFDYVFVRYRYRGFTRLTKVRLISHLMFVSPPDDLCPRGRE